MHIATFPRRGPCQVEPRSAGCRRRAPPRPPGPAAGDDAAAQPGAGPR
jgi:hypothetical protein